MAGHQCSLCNKTFSRQEHLRRHELSHGDPQFQCGTCSKSFHRKDALNKHEQIHQSDRASLLQKGARACSACATVKSRCTGERPCARCSSRKIECIYIASRNRSATEEPNSPDKLAENAPVISYQSHQDHAAVKGHTVDQQLPQHSPLVDHSLAIPATLYNGHPEAVIQQTSSFAQGQNGFDPGSQFEVAAPLDWAANSLSTINWLQSDPMSFNDDDWSTMFPIFPDEYSFSPSVDFVSPAQQFEIEDSAHASLQNGIPQSQTRTPSHTLLSQQPTPHAASSATGDKSTIASGEYYVDGDAGRLPKTKRRKVVTALKGSDRLEEPILCLEYTRPPIPCTEQRLHLSHEQYDQLRVMYLRLCSETLTFKTFRQAEFPSKQVLEGLLAHYFTHFDQTMPFLHVSTFSAQSRHCALLLAMMALGSNHLDDDDTHVFALSMHEFVRRYLILAEEQRFLPQETAQTLSQVQLLHAVGAGHTQYEPLFISASRSLSAATLYCRNEWARQFHEGVSGTRHDDAPTRWRAWIQKQELLRTGFCIWMLDSLWACQFHQSPHMCLEDATTMELPCPERTWAAPTAIEWTLQISGILNPPTLLEALQHLYVDKRLLPNLGEFSRILLINGLYHRTWQVQKTVTQSLANFEPSAHKQASSDFQSKQPVWPPSVPLFNRWRNSACDCLDILHWSANATIGAASGMEHPTVLHLHLSRLVLLAPMQDIVRFAHYLIRSSKNFGCLSPLIPSSAEVDENRRLIQRWAVQDQYKARLSAIHAGVVFWHVRLYAINAFYEPTTVAHAALLLWALSAFSPKKSAVPASPQDSPSPDLCDIILIDRPTDDELVQQFVRQGNSMHANMTGVGDLFGVKGPRKVLVEGQKLLGTLRSWRGVTEHWLHVLARLEKVTTLLGVNTAGSRERTAAAE